MFGFKKETLKENQPTAKSHWHDGQLHCDTVVFVHGILGKHGTTWGKFQELLHTDEDLPRLDLLSWGYRSGLVPGSYQDVETEGDALIGDLETLVREGNHIFLVGHSMGGLVILKGLVNRILLQQGRAHPVAGVQRIVLYATPLLGTAVANVVKFALSLHSWIRAARFLFPHKQLSDLRRGDFCDQLLARTNELIYRPGPGSLLVTRGIPVRACAAKHDSLVSKYSAIGIFQDPTPKYLEGDHETVKLPHHHRDLRYMALKQDIETTLAGSFQTLCKTVNDSPVEETRRKAAIRLDLRYGAMFETCTRVCFSPREITDEDRFEVAGMIYKAGAKSGAPPAQVIAEVSRDYAFRARYSRWR